MIVETVRPSDWQRFRIRCTEAGCIGPVNNDAAVLEIARGYAQAHADKWRHVVEIDDTAVYDRHDAQEPAPVDAAPEMPFKVFHGTPEMPS